jgi:hypothetical protein
MMHHPSAVDEYVHNRKQRSTGRPVVNAIEIVEAIISRPSPFPVMEIRKRSLDVLIDFASRARLKRSTIVVDRLSYSAGKSAAHVVHELMR